MGRSASGTVAAVSAAPRLLLAALFVVMLTACRIDADVAVVVREDGSGTVAVTVRFDPDAVARVPDLAAALRTSDLVTAGWQITGPDRGDAGVRYTATKPFRSPDQLAAVLSELTGTTGAFREVALVRSRSFAKRTWTLTATADLSKGVALFGDAQLAAALGGKLLGRDQAALEAELGAPLNSFVHTTFSVTMPDAAEANTPTVDGATATWVFQLGDPAPHDVRAASDSTALQPRVWAYLAAGAGFALVVVVGVQAMRRRKPILRQ